MKEDIFNMQTRKFLKKVGVTSQRKIKTAIRGAVKSGRLSGNETVKTRVILSIESLGLEQKINGGIYLA